MKPAALMEETPLESAVREKAELKAARRKLMQEIDKKKQKSDYQEQAAKKKWLVAGSLLNMVLMIYALADCTAKPAAKYLIIAAKKRQWPEKPEADVVRMVEDSFLDARHDEVMVSIDADRTPDSAALKEAMAFVEEWRLFDETAGFNYKQGIAPSTEFVLQRYNKHIAELPEDFRPRQRGTSAEAANRMWAGRWRARWKGKISKIKVAEDIPVETMRSKAMDNMSQNGADIWYHIWYHMAVLSRDRRTVPRLYSFHGAVFRSRIRTVWRS